MFRRFVIAVALFMSLPALANAQTLDFIGTWEWAVTVYVLGGTESPSSTGHTRQLMFAPDGAFVRYEDNQIVHAGYWELGEITGPSFMIMTLYTSDGNTWYSWSASPGGGSVLTLRNWVSPPIGIIGPNSKTEYYGTRLAVAAQSRSWGSVKASYR